MPWIIPLLWIDTYVNIIITFFQSQKKTWKRKMVNYKKKIHSTKTSMQKSQQQKNYNKKLLTNLWQRLVYLRQHNQAHKGYTRKHQCLSIVQISFACLAGDFLRSIAKSMNSFFLFSVYFCYYYFGVRLFSCSFVYFLIIIYFEMCTFLWFCFCIFNILIMLFLFYNVQKNVCYKEHF